MCAGIAGAVVGGEAGASLALTLAATVLAGFAWWGCLSTADRTGPSLTAIVWGAILLRAIALCGEPLLSDDVYRYVWEGQVAAAGASPYAFAPSSAELAPLRAQLPELASRVAHPDVPAAYPPLVQLQGALVARVVEACGGDWTRRVLAHRLLAAVFDLLVLVPLVALLRRAGRPVASCVAWAWCPLVTLEFAGSGHFDSLGILLWTMALWALASGRSAVGGTVALAASIVVKLLPLASLPFLARHRRRPVVFGLAVSGLVACSFLPLLGLRGGASGLFAGLGQYALRWESTSLVYRFVEMPCELLTNGLATGDPRVLGRVSIGAAWLAVGVVLWRRRVPPVRASFVMTGAFLVLTPTLHPWYVTWIVPFLALYPRPAWTWLAVVAPLFYSLLDRWQREGVWEEPIWVWPVVALPFFALLVWHAASGARRARSSPPQVLP